MKRLTRIHILLLGLVVAAVSCRELAAAALDRNLENSSEKLLLSAKTALARQSYWEGARDLIILMDFNPTFSKADEVVFLLGDCLYDLGLNNGAGKLYTYLLNRYVRSPYLPQALLGLQRIEFDRGDYARCLEFYNTIVRSNAPSDVMDASSYYAGQCYYRFKDHPKAIQLFSSISDKSRYYDYGQYTMGLSHLRMKNIRQAISTLHGVCNLVVTGDERRSVIDEAHLTLGYLYYELGYYAPAFSQFNAVSALHKNYDAALLAAGWAASMQEKYTDAIVPLTTLVNQFPKTENGEEALFLLGRSYLKLKRYNDAMSVYDHLIELFPKKETIPALVQQVRTSLKDANSNLEKTQMDLLVLESKLLDAMPISIDNKAPTYLKDESQRLMEMREGLLKRIHEERQVFNELSEQMDELQRLADRREARRDWRGFAEFGRSRAMFLGTIQ
jgi:tetratricopeptide (TPR) repeat protein